jgi:hypothetical protein
MGEVSNLIRGVRWRSTSAGGATKHQLFYVFLFSFDQWLISEGKTVSNDIFPLQILLQR